MGELILRLFSFGRGGVLPDVDVALRGVVVPGLVAAPGAVCVHAARRAGASDERVVASIWRPEVGTAPDGMESALLAEALDDDDRGTDVVEMLPVAVGLTTAHTVQPAILRLFRGRVRPGELDEYLAEVRGGALSDAASNEGLAELYLGAEPPHGFVTVSLWATWEHIAEATGGDIHRPMATRNGDRIAEHTVAHYEVVASGTPGG